MGIECLYEMLDQLAGMGTSLCRYWWGIQQSANLNPPAQRA
jgi:hypothetical protein